MYLKPLLCSARLFQWWSDSLCDPMDCSHRLLLSVDFQGRMLSRLSFSPPGNLLDPEIVLALRFFHHWRHLGSSYLTPCSANLGQEYPLEKGMAVHSSILFFLLSSVLFLSSLAPSKLDDFPLPCLKVY